VSERAREERREESRGRQERWKIGFLQKQRSYEQHRTQQG
jgi:hypothetical protein